MILDIKPISINKAFRGRRFKTQECNDYEDDFMKIAPRQKMIEGIVEIEYKFYTKNHKMADIDNMIKVTQDLLVKCHYIEDDRKIYKLIVYKIPSDRDYMEIEIKKLTNNKF